MARFSLDNYFKVLFDIDPETNDFSLEDDEYIRIVAIKKDSSIKWMLICSKINVSVASIFKT